MRKVGKKMSETVIVGSMEIWRQNAKQIEHLLEIREEIERIEEAGVETEAEAEGLGDRRDDNAEEEEEEFEIDDGRRLEIEVRVREEVIEEDSRIVEPEEGQQIPEIHLEVEAEANVVEEVRRNENENEVRIEGEVENEGEIINIADDEGDNAGRMDDFLV
jgi:hypothetical protein